MDKSETGLTLYEWMYLLCKEQHPQWPNICVGYMYSHFSFSVKELGCTMKAENVYRPIEFDHIAELTGMPYVLLECRVMSTKNNSNNSESHYYFAAFQENGQTAIIPTKPCRGLRFSKCKADSSAPGVIPNNINWPDRRTVCWTCANSKSPKSKSANRVYRSKSNL